MNHVRPALWLLLLTLVICSVLYPLLLLGIGKLAFPRQAEGSLVTDANGEVKGSRLIAQPFTEDEYFQPRPSAASYKADASAASNWGPSNYRLRDRVARQLGPIVRYGKGTDGKKEGELVGPDIERWFRKDVFGGKPGIVAQWAQQHPGLAEDWIKATGDALKQQWRTEDTLEAFMAQWQKNLHELQPEWKAASIKAKLTSSNLADLFFASFARAYPGSWPALADDRDKRKKLERINAGSDIQSVFFDMWRQEHPHVALLEVPADMVMASGSGLDPHITLKNALYQARYRVAAAQADKLIKADKLQADDARRQEIEDKAYAALVTLLNEHAEAPLGGLAGVPLINVLEVNLALPSRMHQLAATIK